VVFNNLKGGTMKFFAKKSFWAAPVLAAALLAGCSDKKDPVSPTGGSTMFDGMRVVKDADINAGQSFTMYKDTTYLLDGLVFVENGAVLNIQAGTVLKFKAGGGYNSSALIIAKGGKINANGTATQPIILTAQQDDLTQTDDMNPNTRGLWGGLVILGKSVTNRAAGTHQIEGIDPTDTRGAYGEATPVSDDSSGVVRYVSIRYGGTNIGEGNELNGLTMGAVGSKTVVEYVEVLNNDDDGFEWFGGTVNCKYLVSVGNADDSYDWDEGFRGKGQFWVVAQSPEAGDRAFECDGNPSDNRGDATKYAAPTLYNMTVLGRYGTLKDGTKISALGNMAFKLREETGGYFYNSIFAHFYGDVAISGGQLTSVGIINFDDADGTAGNKVSDHVTSGTLKIKNNIFYGFSNHVVSADSLVKFSGTIASGTKTALIDSVKNSNVFAKDSITHKVLVPPSTSRALTATRHPIPSDGFFTAAAYIGAFGTTNWMSGWTAYETYFKAQVYGN
jgi:hypothetical protein